MDQIRLDPQDKLPPTPRDTLPTKHPPPPNRTKKVPAAHPTPRIISGTALMMWAFHQLSESWKLESSVRYLMNTRVKYNETAKFVTQVLKTRSIAIGQSLFQAALPASF